MIRLAIYNDVMANSAQTSEEEAQDIYDELDNLLEEDLNLIEHSNAFNPDVKTDIIVLDYGGAQAFQYDFVRGVSDMFIDYLVEHESTLGIVWSSFNRQLMEDEFNGEFEDLNNLCFRYGNRTEWDFDKEEDEFENKLSTWFMLKESPISEFIRNKEENLLINNLVEDEIDVDNFEIPEEKVEIKKKRQITDYPYIEFTVRAYDTTAKKFDGEENESGLAVFCTFATDVSDDDGSELGMVAGGTGAVVISINNGGYFLIKHDDLWYAINKALGDKKHLE